MVAHAYRIARRIVIGAVGSTVLLVGIVLLFTPGPAFVVIPAGLGILALEFAWAKRWLHEAKTRGTTLVQVLRQRSGR